MKNLILILILIVPTLCPAQSRWAKFTTSSEVSDDAIYQQTTSSMVSKSLNRTAGEYFQLSTKCKTATLFCGVIGGGIAAGFASSDKKDTRKVGYIAGGAFGLCGVGSYIASLVYENKAGKKLDIEIKAINAKLGIADTGAGVKLSF